MYVDRVDGNEVTGPLHKQIEKGDDHVSWRLIRLSAASGREQLVNQPWWLDPLPMVVGGLVGGGCGDPRVEVGAKGTNLGAMGKRGL